MIRSAPSTSNLPPLSTTEVTKVYKACDDLGEALDQGGIGDIVAKHEKLILHYYQDVQEQARQSFTTARRVAVVGFIVLIATVVYALTIDVMTRLGIATSSNEAAFTIAGIGLVSGALIEFIAAIAFWLYSRGSRQFGAFHICLERTHRYLLAYKITEQMQEHRNETVEKLVCIMANAPMITHGDVESPSANRNINQAAWSPAPSGEV